MVTATTAAAHDVRNNVDRDREDDRAVLLGRDVVEGLQVSQLKREYRPTIITLATDPSGFFESWGGGAFKINSSL